MSLLSYTARRLPGALAAALSLLVLAAGPAHAATKKAPKIGKNMVGAGDVQSVIRYLASKGDTVEIDQSDAGFPMLIESNNYYEVYFSCDEDGTNCNAIQFRACYADYPEGTVEKANTLNRDFFFAKSYIDDEGYACIETPVATGLKGISYEALDVSFEAFVAFTETADDAFGPRAGE